MVAYEPRERKMGKMRMRTKSEAAVEYAEVMDGRERSPRKGRRASHEISERIFPMEVIMPTIKIMKEANEKK